VHAVDQYIGEHRVIASVVDAFERYLVAVERGSEVEQQDLARFVGFFREFTDLGHHEKEEGILIPAMVRSGCVWDDGPVEQVRKDHHQERYLMGALRQSALQQDPWSPEARRRVVSTAREYIAFMRAHVALEEDALFPRARQCLSGDSEAAVRAAFNRFDEEWDATGELGFLRELAVDLMARYPHLR
jgi:hemerythrin-like domain-containing protein